MATESLGTLLLILHPGTATAMPPMGMANTSSPLVDGILRDCIGN